MGDRFQYLTIAELWGICQGLLLAWEVGIRDTHIEPEYLIVLAQYKLLPRDVILLILAPFIRGIQELMGLDWQVALNHIYRESNYATDFMASYALELPLESIL